MPFCGKYFLEKKKIFLPYQIQRLSFELDSVCCLQKFFILVMSRILSFGKELNNILFSNSQTNHLNQSDGLLWNVYYNSKFDYDYLGKQSVAWKEFCSEYFQKVTPGQQDRCICSHNMT